ncbi:MAG: SsrA-binding protein SmpB [Alphaproteobacteria bacterium]|nr:SsrA-binding protein SmpB [Alphaproteobacteria bacterium]
MEQHDRKDTIETGAIAVNRKARFSYAIGDTFEAGLVLLGPEVKSLRMGKASISESYASVEKGELWLINCNIQEYGSSGYTRIKPTRPRKLLVSQKELKKLQGLVARKGFTLVPLKMYFNQRGLVKVLVGVATGKTLYDKRATEAERDWQRQKARILKG